MVAIIFLFLQQGSAEAAKYLWGDPNDECVRSHMGIGYYVDKSSLAIKSVDYHGDSTWAVHVVIVNEKEQSISDRETYWYYRNGQGDSYCRIDRGEWREFDAGEYYGYNQVIVLTYRLTCPLVFGSPSS